jgi:hypothetical protein
LYRCSEDEMVPKIKIAVVYLCMVTLKSTILLVFVTVYFSLSQYTTVVSL